MTSAERVRLWRERQQLGRAVWRIEVNEADVETMLVHLRRVSPYTEERSDFELALSELVEEMASDETRYAAFLREHVRSRP